MPEKARLEPVNNKIDMDQKPLLPQGSVRPGGWRRTLGGLLLFVTLHLTSCQGALMPYLNV